MGKIAAAGCAIKNAKLPSPGEIKDGYLNSAFHKSLHQPLMVKTKVEKTDVQQARQAMTQVGYQQLNVVVSYVVMCMMCCRTKPLCSWATSSQ